MIFFLVNIFTSTLLYRPNIIQEKFQIKNQQLYQAYWLVLVYCLDKLMKSGPNMRFFMSLLLFLLSQNSRWIFSQLTWKQLIKKNKTITSLFDMLSKYFAFISLMMRTNTFQTTHPTSLHNISFLCNRRFFFRLLISCWLKEIVHSSIKMIFSLISKKCVKKIRYGLHTETFVDRWTRIKVFCSLEDALKK